eukprot:7368837-Prymnesium_polylepis.1
MADAPGSPGVVGEVRSEVAGAAAGGEAASRGTTTAAAVACSAAPAGPHVLEAASASATADRCRW